MSVVVKQSASLWLVIIRRLAREHIATSDPKSRRNRPKHRFDVRDLPPHLRRDIGIDEFLEEKRRGS